MDILELIKNRKTIRKYKDKPIPREILDKIIEAGIWGPSVPSFLRIQPWKFIVIINKNTIRQIVELLLEKSRQSPTGVNIMLSSASRIIGNADTIILVYNSRELEKIKERYKDLYSKFAKIIKTAQLSAISAAIQNMILAAEDFGIGSCWLDTPLFCKKELKKFLKVKEDLAAVLTLGYPDEKGNRSPRKPFSEAVKYIE